jgi:hypothetical protein
MIPTTLFLALGMLLTPRTARAAEAVSFVTDDRVEVFADYYPASAKARPLILLFHRAGSNRAEYETIDPMLTSLDFNALAIDRRAGVHQWGMRTRRSSAAARAPASAKRA